MFRSSVLWILGLIGLVFVIPHSASAQNEADVAMQFFRQGGTYCFRLAPEGTNLSEETAWTVMMLTSASNRHNEFRIRSMDPGSSGLSGGALKNVGLTITAIWRRDGLRDEFFERFSMAIAGGILRARVVTVSLPRLAEMKERDRAELYLKFADKGTKVDFSKVADLTADQFMEYQSYLPD